MRGNLELLYNAITHIDNDVMEWFIPEDVIVNNTGKGKLMLKIHDITKVFAQFQNQRLELRAKRLHRETMKVAVVIFGCFSKHFIAFTLEQKSNLEFEVGDLDYNEYFGYLQLDSLAKIDIHFFKDELVGFVPSMKYYHVNDTYEELLKEIEESSIDDLDINDVESWLDCASEAYEQITPYRLQFRNCYLFYRNYNTLLDMLALFELDNSLKDALDAYDEIKRLPEINHEIGLHDWVEENQWLYEEIGNLRRYKHLLRPDTNNIRLSGLFQITVSNKELLSAIKFLETFEAHFTLLEYPE